MGPVPGASDDAVTNRRTVLTGLALAATVAAAGCLDALAPGRAPRLASLGLVPLFEGVGAHDGIPSDVDSIVVTIHNPPAPDITISQRILPGQDSIVITVDVPMTASIDTMSMSLVAIRTTPAPPVVLYRADSVPLTVRVGQPTRADTVRATYVGPGQNIQSITISPRSAAMRPGDTLSLSASAIDSTGATISGMPVLWTSHASGIVSVSAGGTARAVANGEAWVVAISGARSSVRDSAEIIVATTPVAVIGFAPATLTFTAPAGGANPASQTVTVSNAGAGPLANLSVSGIQYTSGQTTGWLAATLGGTTAPTTLTVQATTGALAPGTYTASVLLASTQAANSPMSLPVTFVVSVVPLVSIAVTPGFGVVRVTDTLRLQVSGKDGNGNAIAPGVPTYTSRSPAVATVSSSGLVTGAAGGTAVIVASAQGATGPVLDSTLVAVAATGSAVAVPLAGGRAFGSARVGDTVVVRVAVDLRGVPSERLGSYLARLNWTPSTLGYVTTALVSGGFVEPTVNADSTGLGQLRFGAANPTGTLGPVIGLLDIKFVAAAAGTTPLTFTVTDLSAASTFTQMVTTALVLSTSVRVQ